ncbi:TetR/AcrR family transcriptional regulator [Bradyrhizobium sp. S3.9.1]|uniref:TetR/AcrR family transcriptional regulator n=1 Tax=Bradyrhizobium sp. S3.9.1 TaxID=3156431 RepID=UPI0033965B54
MSRAREFDETEIIDKALQVFWQRGYEGTSLNDLLDATGLSKSSLYAAFGSKEDLFHRIVERYLSKHVEFRQACALAEPTPRRIVERLLYGMADLHAGSRTPPGCLITGAALACSPEAESIRQELVRSRNEFGQVLRRRLEAVTSAGPLPPGMTAADAARLVVVTIQGMAVEAKGGATRNELRRLVQTFLLNWPEN